MNKLHVKKIFVYLFCLLAILSAILSFRFNINLSNIFGEYVLNEFLLNHDIQAKSGGSVSDILVNWKYLQLLNSDINNLLLIELGKDTTLKNFPLHSIIFSQFDYLAKNIKNYLLIFFLFSFLIPFIFYLSLKEKFKNIDNLDLLVLVSLIIIFPSFQYSAIWGNSHNTSLIFFILSILFHQKLINQNYNSYNLQILTVFSLSLAAYTKQFYVFFFIFLLLDFFKNLKISNFIFILLFTTILAVPGILFLIKNPLLFFGYKGETTNFFSSILISSSIIFFYLLPFIIQEIYSKVKQNNFNILSIFNYKIFTSSVLIFLISFVNFFYNGSIGGGVFYKLFFHLINIKFIFFIFSFLGIYFLFYFTKNQYRYYLLSIFLLTTFSTGYWIFQKYFEIMFFFIFLFYYYDQSLKQEIKEKNLILVIYFSSYFIISNFLYLANQ